MYCLEPGPLACSKKDVLVRTESLTAEIKGGSSRKARRGLTFSNQRSIHAGRCLEKEKPF
jgi:hypothetical protein